MTAIANHPHRVTSAIADARARLAAVTEVPVWSMDAAETTASLDQLAALAAQVAELQARVLAHGDRTDIAAESGATSTANWHAHRTRTTRPQAHRTMRLAAGLEQRDLTRAALACGAVHVEQAEVILRALAELPDDLDPELYREGRAAAARTRPALRRQNPQGSWAAGSSKSSPPTPPTPTKPPCSNARNTPRPPLPG